LEYKDYYHILGVAKDASQDDIKRAYRKLARKYHPDVSKEADAEVRFKELGEAYEVLKDPEKRQAYDQLGNNWQAGQSGFNPPPNWNQNQDFGFNGGGYTSNESDFSDFFESLFGRRAGRAGANAGSGRTRAMRGEDSHARISIDLADAYTGATRSLTLRTTEYDANGQPYNVDKTLNVKIPKGIKAGQSIRLQGQGNPSFGGGEAGDLYLEVAFNEHSLYQVEGRDVSIELPIAPWESALGAKITVPTPVGSVELKVPVGASSGKRMRLKGRGIPGKEAGDFYVTLEIVMPPTVSDTEKSLYESLQKAAGNFNPRGNLGA
jgi:curved DNA-binding protein